jgi:hypothetical protein
MPCNHPIFPFQEDQKKRFLAEEEEKRRFLEKGRERGRG